MNNDNVNNPKHYCSHPSGVECIEIAEMLPFNLGNALKYLWRAGKKLDEVEDIKKAVFYLRRQANSQHSLGRRHTNVSWHRIHNKMKKVLMFDEKLGETVDVICFGKASDFVALADELETEYGLKL